MGGTPWLKNPHNINLDNLFIFAHFNNKVISKKRYRVFTLSQKSFLNGNNDMSLPEHT